MSPFVRTLVFFWAVVSFTATAFFLAATAVMDDDPGEPSPGYGPGTIGPADVGCPSTTPERVEDGSCVSASFFEEGSR